MKLIKLKSPLKEVQISQDLTCFSIPAKLTPWPGAAYGKGGLSVNAAVYFRVK